MKGTVQFVNPQSGTFAVATDDGFTVVEVLDRIEVEVDDEVVGKLDEDGGVTLRHVPSGANFDAFVQAVGASEASARALLQPR
jgi:hypothetical protein